MSTAQAIPLDPRPVPKEQKQRPAAREKQKRTTGRATVEDAEERTPVLAVLGTPSVSVARVAGTIRVSIVGGVPCLLIGKEDSESDQIKFWLSDCEFAYGDFRDEESAALKFEGFLVVGSEKGDTRSLCEMKS